MSGRTYSNNMEIIPINNLIKRGGAFFCQNFRSSANGGVVNGYSMEESNNGNNAYIEAIDYGSDALTSNISEYITRRSHGDGHYSDYLVYKGGNYRGSGTYNSLGLLITDQNGDKNDYNFSLGSSASDSRYGIMQDAFGEVCWSGVGKIGRTFTGYIYSYTPGVYDTIAISGIDAGKIEVDDYLAVIKYTDGTSVKSIEYIKVTDVASAPVYTVSRGQLGTKHSATSALTSGIVVLMKYDWKDVSAIDSGNWGPMIQFNDKMYVAVDNLVYVWSLEDASDIALALTLPTSNTIKKLTFAKTGSGDRIYIITEDGQNGNIFLWDGEDTTWEYKLPFNEKITASIDNYVATNSGVYQTNGYSKELLFSLPGLDRDLSTTPIEIEDMRIINNYLLLTSNVDNEESLYKRGFYLYDLVNSELTHVPPYNKEWYGKIFGAVIIDYNKEIYLSHDNKISKLSNVPASDANTYQFIFNPTNSRLLSLKELYLNIDFGMYSNLTQDAGGEYNVEMDIIVRCYDFRKPFSNNLLTISGTQPTEENKITLLSIGNVKVGDRVELLGGNAGTIRNVTEIDGTTLTLDEDIDSKTAANADKVILNPLKKIGSITIDSEKMPREKLRIPLSVQPEFRRALFEIEIRPANTSILPRINSVELNLEQNDL